MFNSPVIYRLNITARLLLIPLLFISISSGMTREAESFSEYRQSVKNEWVDSGKKDTGVLVSYENLYAEAFCLDLRKRTASEWIAQLSLFHSLSSRLQLSLSVQETNEFKFTHLFPALLKISPDHSKGSKAHHSIA